MFTINILPFFMLEVCVSFSLIWNFMKVRQELTLIQIVLPFVIHYFILFFKLALLARDRLVNTDRFTQLLISCLFGQSVGIGVITYSYNINVNYMQVLVCIQYVFVMNYKELYKPSIVAACSFLVPEIFRYYDSIFELLEVILQAIVAINVAYCMQKTQEKPLPLKEKQKSIVLEQEEVRLSMKHKVLQQMPFLTDERFIVFNNLREILHDQLDILNLVDENIEKDIAYIQSQKLNILFDIKCESLSNTLLTLLNANEYVSQYQSYLRTNILGYKKRNYMKTDLGSLVLKIFEQADCTQFYSVYDLESKLLNLHNIKLNIFLINDFEIDEDAIVIHIENHIEKRYTQTKSLGTFSNNAFTISHKSSDQFSNQLLSQIFRSVSHEFGTYLNCILTLSQEALQNQLMEVDIKASYFEPIYINAKLLSYILLNIRDFNTILLNQFSIRLQEFNLSHAIDDILYLVRHQAMQRNITIKVDCPESLVVFNDQDRFKQVVYQLFSNSIRFTQDGTINLEVEKSGTSRIKLTLTDTGIGMNDDEQKKLTELLRDSRKLLRISNNSVGCGLGLSISNEIVKKMNGNSKMGLKFRSQSKNGSSFFFQMINQEQLYNESVYDPSQTVFKINETFHIEMQPSEYSRQRMLSGSIIHVQNDEKSESMNTLLRQFKNKQHSSSTRKKSQETYIQFFQRQIDQPSDSLDKKSDDELNSNEDSNIVIPSCMTNNLRHSVIQYKISSRCCQRVLIIDDEYFNILSLQVILKKFSALSDSAFNGKQALDKVQYKVSHPCGKCRNAGYMVYFIDLNMPIMDGFSTVRELKRLMKEKQIPTGVCIANSGYADLESKQNAIKAGMDYYLTKPVDINELEKYLRDKFKLVL